MKNDPDFRVFIDDMLREMGYLNENGQFEIINQEEIVKPKPVLLPEEDEDL